MIMIMIIIMIIIITSEYVLQEFLIIRPPGSIT